jgi:hypothetical protein
MGLLADKVTAMSKEAKRMNSELSSIQREQEKYRGSVLLYANKAAAKAGYNVGIITRVDFVEGVISVRVCDSSSEQRIFMSQFIYEIVSKEDLLKKI